MDETVTNVGSCLVMDAGRRGVVKGNRKHMPTPMIKRLSPIMSKLFTHNQLDLM